MYVNMFHRNLRRNSTGTETTRERILEIAGDRFYSRGYQNTGTQEIVDVCGITKPSLYYHFPTKAALGVAYLEAQEKGFFKLMEAVGASSNSLSDFFGKWNALILRLARQGRFHGCPFTGFASQMEPTQWADFSPALMKIRKRWLDTLESIFKTDGFHVEPSECTAACEEVMVLYTGSSQLYRMTGDREYLVKLGHMMQLVSKRIVKKIPDTDRKKARSGRRALSKKST